MGEIAPIQNALLGGLFLSKTKNGWVKGEQNETLCYIFFPINDFRKKPIVFAFFHSL